MDVIATGSFYERIRSLAIKAQTYFKKLVFLLETILNIPKWPREETLVAANKENEKTISIPGTEQAIRHVHMCKNDKSEKLEKGLFISKCLDNIQSNYLFFGWLNL